MNSQNYFDTIASDWNHIRTLYFKDDILPYIRSAVDFTDKTVVDLGSGTGYIALAAAPIAKHVYAIDQSEKMLESIARHQVPNITTLKTGIIPEILQTESVDVVTINMALHHVEEIEVLFQEVYRILKPNGKFIISDVMKHDGYWAKEEMHDVWLGFDLEEIDSYSKKAGFRIERLINTHLRARAQSSQNEIIDTEIFLSVGIKGEEQ